MGLFAALLSATLSASKDLISKRLASRLDGTSSTYASFAFAVPYYAILLIVLYFLGWEVLTVSAWFWVLVVLRASTDALAEGLKMHAFVHGDISIVATFFSLAPLFLLFTSPLITGDPLSIPEAASVILVVLGSLLLVYRPSARGWAEQRKGIVLATLAAVFFSLNSCFDRRAVQEGTPVFAGFTMTALSAGFLLPWVLFSAERQEKMRGERGGLWLRGFLEVAFMVSKLTALQYLKAPEVVGMMRLSLVLSIVGGKLFFKEPDFGRRLAAGLLILAGVFAIAWLRLSGAIE
jgi:uncharacterized membrane protein